MRRLFGWSLAALTVALIGNSVQAAEKTETRESFTFGALTGTSEKAARRQAYQWLQKAGKLNDQTRDAFNKLWSQKDLSVLDKVSGTFELGDKTIATMLTSARDDSYAAPTTVPKILEDTTHSGFFRANLALAYAKALSNRKVYEESLSALKKFKPEQVVDPGTYLFHRAVAEHAMLLKNEATQSISRLLDDVPDAPERYKMVATLMFFDMSSWKAKDLEAISRMMKNIERRLDLARGGSKTQDMQKKVVLRLDEIIKELENSQSGSCCSGGNCPGGAQAKAGSKPGTSPKSSSPQQDSIGGTTNTAGRVDMKKIKDLAEQWGKLPPRERARAMRELTRDYPPKYREVIKEYFRRVSLQTGVK
jgi:hypothetical protein